MSNIKVGDRVKSKVSGQVFVVVSKGGRDPINRRRTLFGVKGIDNRLPNAFNSGEIEKY